ncbi:hypothetical protein KXV85_006257, partial [Aspergillus fumigatus]
PHLRAAIEAFPPQALRDWSRALGQETFVGSSGRVFPEAFKASPLLRACRPCSRAREVAQTPSMPSSPIHSAAVIGAGPAGLMAAEMLARGGARVTVYDAMPSPARKFLMAGRGGLNLTHSEPLPEFLA